MHSNGKMRVRIPLPDKQLRSQRDINNPGVTETIWNPLLTREVFELFKDPRMGQHNVRAVKTNSDVMRDVYTCVTEEPEKFWQRHGGFVIIANRRTANDDFVEFTFDFDNGRPGFANGNSSRATLVEAVEDGLLDRIESGELVAPQLRISIFTGLEEADMVELGIGRNEQLGVTDSTTMNARGEYEIIKENLDQLFNEQIAYKQNESGNRYKVENVVQDIVAMDHLKWPDGDQNPVMTYVSRISPRNHYRSNAENMMHLAPLFEDILIFHEIIQRDFVEAYGKNRGVKLNAKFWDATGIVGEEGEFHFIEGDRKYKVPRALTMPILSAFRQCILASKAKKTQWIFIDFDGLCGFWDEIAPLLTKRVVAYVEDEGDANSAAKKNMLWTVLYEDVERAWQKMAAQMKVS
jgi:AIPR protein